jgi:hypothetical protein
MKFSFHFGASFNYKYHSQGNKLVKYTVILPRRIKCHEDVQLVN